MNTLRRGGTFLHHEDYIEGIAQVQAKKKSHLNYYAWSTLIEVFLLFSKKFSNNLSANQTISLEVIKDIKKWMNNLNKCWDQFLSAASLSFLSLLPSFLWLFHSCLSDL